LIVGLLALIVRIPFLSVPLMSDEGGYGYAAYWWSKGLHLYDELWFDRPQAIFVLYRIIFATLGSSVVSIRIGVAIVSALTAWLVYLLAKRYFDRNVALLRRRFVRCFLRRAADRGVSPPMPNRS